MLYNYEVGWQNTTTFGTENVNPEFKPVMDFYVEKIFSSSFQQIKINVTMKVLLVVLLII